MCYRFYINYYPASTVRGRRDRNNPDYFWSLGEDGFQKILVEFFYYFLFLYKPEDFNFPLTGEVSLEELEKIDSEISQTELKLSNLEKQIIEKKKELAKTVREIHKDSKDSLSYKMTQREKKIRDWSQGLDKSQVKPGEGTMQEWLKTRYSIDIGNSYVDHEYAYLKTANRIGKTPSNFLYGAEQLLNKYIVGTLEDIKNYVNDFFGNIINALKNLNVMLEQSTFSQFNILGEIMQLVHIIRAFNLIKKLVDEGFEGCDKLSESKAQEKILKDALEEISEGKISAKVISKNNSETGSQDFYLKTYSKKSKFNHITDLKDCSDSASLLRKRNLNTDQLYDMMKESMV